MKLRVRSLLAGLLVAGMAMVPASAAAAGGSTVDARSLATLTVEKLILEPTDRGYVGTLPAAVTWHGPDGDWLDIVITEPVAGAWQNMINGETCVWNEVVDGRRTISCTVVGLQHGETRDITQKFRVLTTPRPYAMSASSESIWATQGETMISKAKTYSTTFRGTNGSQRNPKPYIQDTRSNASLSIGNGPVSMVPHADGYYLGRLPMTVQWKGDAPHWNVNIDATLPGGWIVWSTDPWTGLPCGGGCSVPTDDYGFLMQGEIVTFDLIIYAPEGAQPGSYGPITVTATAYWTDGALADLTPADNSATFTAVL